MLPFIQADFDLDTVSAEWTVSSATLAAAIASLAAAPLSDTSGRRPPILLAAVCMIAGAIFVCSAGVFAVLITGRSLLGFSIGLASAIVPTFASELAPRSRRGSTVICYDLSIVLGQLLAGLINGGFFYVESGWRWATGLAVIPAIALLIAIHPLPESPRWLVRNGRVREAQDGLLRIAGEGADARQAAVAELQDARDAIAAEVDGGDGGFSSGKGGMSGSEGGGGSGGSGGGSGGGGGITSAGEEEEQKKDDGGVAGAVSGGSRDDGQSGGVGASSQRAFRNFLTLWREPHLRRAALVGVLLMLLNQCSGINTIMYYSGTLFSQLYPAETAVWLAAACDAAQLLGVCISLATIDAQGRRRTALRSCLCVTLTLTALAILFATTDAAYADASSGLHAAVAVLIMLYLIAFGSGLSGVGWVVVSEIYPMRVRAVGVSQAIFVNWMLNYLVSQTFLTLADAIGYNGTFGLYAGFAGAGGLLMYRYLPETAGLRLEAIEGLFQDPYPERLPTSVVSEGSSSSEGSGSEGSGSSAAAPAAPTEATSLLP